jgi:hypothetical protein
MSGVDHVQEWLDSGGYNSWDFDESKFERLESGIVLYHGRWTAVTLDVWADEEGHVFGIVYEVPNTEYQEGSEGPPEIVPVTTTESWTTA